MFGKTLNAEVLVSASSARSLNLKVLADPNCSPEAIKQLKEMFGLIAQSNLDESASAAYDAYVRLLEIIELLTRWKVDVRSANPGANSFLEAARLRAAEFEWPKNLNPAVRGAIEPVLQEIRALQLPTGLTPILQKTRGIPLNVPVSSTSNRELVPFGEFAQPEKVTPPVTTVILSFEIAGEPVQMPQFVESATLYELTAKVILSEWPSEATTLQITYATSEKQSVYEMPEFVFERPANYSGGELSMQSSSRMILKYSIAEMESPIEFVFSASFEGGESIRPRLSGQRRLWFDNSQVRATGSPEIDIRLHEFNRQLRFSPNVTAQTRREFRAILGALCQVAKRSINEDILDKISNESQFQVSLQALLRAWPEIADGLDVHSFAGRGITDLTYRQIPIELKAEVGPVTLSSARKYVPQAAQYNVALARGVAILVVLDLSEPDSAPSSIANDIYLERYQPSDGAYSSWIGIVIMRTNLKRPSDLSK